jgi:hypothetical protein
MTFKISKIHGNFAYNLDNQSALSQPMAFLGPNWKSVLNFWLYLDTLSPKQIEVSGDRYSELRSVDDYYRRHRLARNASWGTIGESYSGVAWNKTSTTVGYASTLAGQAAGYATYELIGSHKILGQGKPLTFVPLFL